MTVPLMNSLTISLILYAALLFFVFRFQRSSNLLGLLRLVPKTHWFPAGVLLFITLYSTSSAGLVSAIVTEKGPGDLLILWSSGVLFGLE
jgi:hypothetical protein